MLHAPEQQRPDVAAAREARRVSQSNLDPVRLIFIDETWATTNMTRRFGIAWPAPSRAGPARPLEDVAFVVGLRTTGFTAARYRWRQEWHQLPRLRRTDARPDAFTGDIVILDNLPRSQSRWHRRRN